MALTTAAMRRDVAKSYGIDAPPLQLNEQEFRLTALRPDFGNISIDSLVESFEWTDGSDDALADLNAFVVLTGQITLRKPNPDQPGATINLNDGHVIRCEVRWGGQWTEVWRMRIWKPGLSVSDGAWTFDLSDDMRLLGDSRDDWSYRRGKRSHTRGWLYHEVILDVCKRYHVPVGQIVRGKRRIKKLVRQGTSPIDIIRAAVDLEENYTGRRYIICWRDGKLNVIPLRRNATLWNLSTQITTAMIETVRRGDHATALTARATVRHGKKRTNLVHTEVSAAGVKRYGFIHTKVTYHGVDSAAELRQRAKRSLAKRLELQRTITVTHPGIAFVRRGDALQVSIPSEGYSGSAGIVFCRAVTHRVSAGNYSMDLTLTLNDLLDPRDIQREKDAAARLRKRMAKAAQ